MFFRIYDYPNVFTVVNNVMNPVSFYKCLADETRLKLMLLIQNHSELCVCELTSALEISQPKVSRHLAQLRQCQLLVDRRQGQWIFYSINPELESWCQLILQQTAAANSVFLEQDEQRLAAMSNRPDRGDICC